MRLAFALLLMVETGWSKMLTEHDITDPRIVQAFEEVRRADFLPAGQREHEFDDRPLPIGDGQTTSQPTLIGLMVQELKLRPGCRVLEVGTGSGYQTALLAKLCDQVSSVEIIPALAARAAERLTSLGYRNVAVKAGDGYLGWPERGPFDAIVVSAGAAKIPQPLVEQLKRGGRLVIPLGSGEDLDLAVVVKGADGKVTTTRTLKVRFVPLTGKPADQDRAR